MVSTKHAFFTYMIHSNCRHNLTSAYTHQISYQQSFSLSIDY